MKILIVEDERPAAMLLKKFTEEYGAQFEVIKIIENNNELRDWFQSAGSADIIFCDIELSDGNVLTTLQESVFDAAVIFTTAYENFWQRALQLNGIEYLLKPISKQRVHEALKKAERLRHHFNKDAKTFTQLASLLQQKIAPSYKKRFPVRLNNEMFILETMMISFFRITQGVIMAFTSGDKRFPLTEESLQELEAKLPPQNFFRINRSEIINLEFIDSIKIIGTEYTIIIKGRGERLSVSNSRVAHFKLWLGDSFSDELLQ